MRILMVSFGAGMILLLSRLCFSPLMTEFMCKWGESSMLSWSLVMQLAFCRPNGVGADSREEKDVLCPKYRQDPIPSNIHTSIGLFAKNDRGA